MNKNHIFVYMVIGYNKYADITISCSGIIKIIIVYYLYKMINKRIKFLYIGKNTNLVSVILCGVVKCQNLDTFY